MQSEGRAESEMRYAISGHPHVTVVSTSDVVVSRSVCKLSARVAQLRMHLSHNLIAVRRLGLGPESKRIRGEEPPHYLQYCRPVWAAALTLLAFVSRLND
jgi:hypothetical protein